MKLKAAVRFVATAAVATLAFAQSSVPAEVTKAGTGAVEIDTKQTRVSVTAIHQANFVDSNGDTVQTGIMNIDGLNQLSTTTTTIQFELLESNIP